MIGRRAALAGAAAAWAGPARAEAGVAAEVDAAADAELLRRPALYANGLGRGWVVSRGGEARGLLWGTLHVRWAGAAMPPPAVLARLGHSADLTVETRATAGAGPVRPAWDGDLADPAALASLDGATRGALREAGVGPADEARLSLLGLARLVAAGAPGLPRRPAPRDVVDSRLIAIAEAAGLRVGTLEAAGAAEPVQHPPNGAAAADILRLALRRRDGAAGLAARLLEYYGAGEVGRMMAAVAAWRALPADLAHADAARAVVMGARNRAWIAPLERVLGSPGEHVAAFGCGHLPGGDGVVALLRERGWEVEACGEGLCWKPACD